MAALDSTLPMTEHRSPRARHRRVVIAAVLVALAAVAMGWPTRHGRFLRGDDRRLVLDHYLVNHPSWAHALELLGVVHGDLYQPLAMLSFQVNYALAGVDESGRFAISSYGFHLTNILLHAVNALLVCAVATRIAGCLRVGTLAGLMFACHPFGVETVAWINGRMMLLATTFALLTFWILLRRDGAGRRGVRFAAIPLYLCSLASKVLPGVPLAAAWCDYRRFGRLSRGATLCYGVLLFMAFVATVAALDPFIGHEAEPAPTVTKVSPLAVRGLLSARYYLENYVRPSGLGPWSPPPTAGYVSLETAVGVVELLGFFLLVAASRRRCASAATGLIAFILLIAPFLFVGAARSVLAADRYMYLPSLGLHLALAATVVWLYDGAVRRFTANPVRLVSGALAVALLGLWLGTSWRLAPVWSDSISRDRRVARVWPDAESARAELARSCLFEDRPDEALDVLRRAQRRWPDSAVLASAAGEAYRATGDLPRAIQAFEFAAQRLPDDVRTRYYYALTLEERGFADAAREQFVRILTNDGHYYPAALALARSYERAGRLAEAQAAYQRALTINPHGRDARFGLAMTFLGREDWKRAEEQFNAVLRHDPDDGAARLNLAFCLGRSGRLDQALTEYDRILKDAPGHREARLNRAGLLAANRRDDEAESEYRALLRETPTDRDARVGLSEIMIRAGRFRDLLRLWLDVRGASKAPADTAAWIIWGQVLTGDAVAARGERNGIPQDDPQREFADWAAAFDALRSEDVDRMIALLGPPRRLSDVSTIRRDQARAIRTVVLNDPAIEQDSPAVFYFLARSFAFEGDAVSARRVLTELNRLLDDPASGADSDYWRSFIRELRGVTGDMK